MATYASLTGTAKQDIQAYNRQMREFFRRLATLEKVLETINWEGFATAQVDPFIATVDNTEIIPNSSDLVHSTTTTCAEFKTAQTTMRSVLSSISTNRALIIKLIGPGNA